MLSRDFLLVCSTTIADQEDLLQTSVVPLRTSDDEGIAVGQRVCLCEGEEGFEGGEAAAGRGGEHFSLDYLRGGRGALGVEHGAIGIVELLIDC